MKAIFEISKKFFISGQMLESLSESPLMICDVGAAMGLGKRWEPVSEFLDVLSFEPDSRSGGDGKNFQRALGAEDDTTKTLFLASLPAASSLYRHHPEMNRFVVRGWLQPAGETEVPVARLDFCLDGRRIDFLKVDVEGADLDVLAGARKTLENVLAVQVEVSFAQRHENAPGFSEIDQFMKNAGFFLHSISCEHWLRDNAEFGENVRPQLIWGDAIYLRERIEEADYSKWALLFQAFGFQDFAIDKMPVEWHNTMRRSVRGHPEFFFMVVWRLLFALLLLPVFRGKAWRKCKMLAGQMFSELHRLTNRTGPKKGIFPAEE